MFTQTYRRFDNHTAVFVVPVVWAAPDLVASTISDVHGAVMGTID